ncbi:hypothetical protein [Winogradskyella ludwigii]|jgi:hypothetical protein|uniref:hypothetical protein n=1 Tax=Winogradskyella ludwigii TaxID=2686076 RepID=UPI0015CAF7B7|nr:hypothetical protein [Winogradskyella ludwigii]
MKLLRKAAFAMILAVIFGITFPCSGQTNSAITTYQEQAPFNVNSVYFQEWYAGIKVGGTGINMFLPITDLADDIKIDRVYFRNLTAELSKQKGKYFARLKNTSPYYTFKKSEAPADYPFKLKDNECVVSYIQNGTTKYYKIKVLNEVAGTYYKDGPPSTYTGERSTGLASVDDSEIDED